MHNGLFYQKMVIKSVLGVQQDGKMKNIFLGGAKNN